MRRGLAPAVAVLLSVLSTAGAAEPTCLTPAAADGHEPVCNPWLWQSSWDQGHRNPYSQHTTPVAGPRPGEDVVARHFGWESTQQYGVILGAFFPPTYPDGRHVAWALAVTGTNDNALFKIDRDTGQVLDVFTHTSREGTPPSERAALSGIYILSDREGHIIQPRGTMIEVYGDEQPGVSTSRIVSLKKYKLPARAFCGSGDRLVGQTMRWDGRIGFITARGVVGVVPSDLSRMDDEHLLTYSINGDEKCKNADKSTAGLETVSNSLAGDEDGGMYPVTSRAQYRFDVRANRIVQTWRAEYRHGTTSASRQDDGSGSTPSLMGTAAHDDKFVAITDGQPLTHLVLFWRDAIPADWRGIGPDRDRRIACEVPINFGDDSVREAQNEQSVAVRGYAALIPQNEIQNVGAAAPIYGAAAAATGLPLQLAIAGLAGGNPMFQPHGFERIDWDPSQRKCVVKWVNKEVSIPNGVPTMSSGSNMVYGLGVRGGVWGLEGLDFDTGESRLWVPADADPFTNSFFSALSIAPDGSVWSGAMQGFTVFRPPPRPELARTCLDVQPPTSALTAVTSRRGRLRASGGATDEGCAGPPRVQVSIAKGASRGHCRFARRNARLTRVRPCRRPLWIAASGGRRWVLAFGRPLARGRYTVRIRARDGAGNVEPVRTGAAWRSRHRRGIFLR